MTSFRLPSGGGVDRGRPFAFTFDGAPHAGFAGDSIASALLASDVRIVGRSFKSHRPRGIWGAWTEEPNAIVDVTRGGKTTPNLRATVEPLEDDMAVRSVNAAPTAAADRAALIDRLAPVLAGFYTRFLWPRWETYEGLDPRHGRPRPRRSGQSSACRQSADQHALRSACRRRRSRGSGRGGRAARAGRAVFLVDDHAEIGGQLAHRAGAIEGETGGTGRKASHARSRRWADRVLTRTTACGVYDSNLVCAWERRGPAPGALWHIRPQRIVIAAGAIERPLVLPDNDRPGVMSADAALVYLKLYAALIGKRVVVATNNDSVYAVAEALAAAGAQVELVDSRAADPACSLPVTRGAAIDGVIGAGGVEATRAGGRTRDCDALLLSGGWSPTVHLYAQARGRLRYDEKLAALVPIGVVAHLSVVGAVNGVFTLADALRQGHEAGGGEGAAPNAPAGRYSIEASWSEANGEAGARSISRTV